MAGSPQEAASPQEEPAMPEAPEMFRLGVAGSLFSWPESDGERNGTDDLVGGGVELEAVVARWIGFRLGVNAGATEITAPDGRATDARQFLVELLVAPRFPVGVLAELGVTPWAELGVGTLVHQPTDSLRARNQNALIVGAGADLDLSDGWGVRLGWRTLEIEQADVFDPDDRSSRDVRGHRAIGAVYWRF